MEPEANIADDNVWCVKVVIAVLHAYCCAVVCVECDDCDLVLLLLLLLLHVPLLTPMK